MTDAAYRIAHLESELSDSESEVERLRAELARAEQQRDDLARVAMGRVKVETWTLALNQLAATNAALDRVEQYRKRLCMMGMMQEASLVAKAAYVPEHLRAGAPAADSTRTAAEQRVLEAMADAEIRTDCVTRQHHMTRKHQHRVCEAELALRELNDGR